MCAFNGKKFLCDCNNYVQVKVISCLIRQCVRSVECIVYSIIWWSRNIVSNSVRHVLCYLCQTPSNFFLPFCFFPPLLLLLLLYFRLFYKTVFLCYYFIGTTHMHINTMADFRMRKYNFHLMFSFVTTSH